MNVRNLKKTKNRKIKIVNEGNKTPTEKVLHMANNKQHSETVVPSTNLIKLRKMTMIHNDNDHKTDSLFKQQFMVPAFAEKEPKIIRK